MKNTTKVTQWAENSLVSHGYTINSQPEHVQTTPWSYVVRFATSNGYIYLKHTPEQLALEATIIQILHDQFHVSVPEVIAHNTELNCFLMKDAGRSLREILKQKFDTELFCKAIDQFTSTQLAVADHVDVFLNIGVPDWRLDKLPDLYKELLSQKKLLIEDGLSEIEISELEKLVPKVSNLCKKLSHYSIKETIVQPDFNDNNTLIDDISQNITMIDLGEIVISHPFFSLINCLQQIKKHHGLTDEDDAYLQIMDACLKNYIKFESRKNLLDAFAIANILFFIYGTLGSHRLMIACDKAKFTSSFQRHGRPSIPLKEFMTACIAIDSGSLEMKLFLIRESQDKDIDALEILFQLTRQKTFKSTPPEQFKIGDYKKSVEGEEIWVAEDNGQIVGFISLWTTDNFIHNLFVHPDWQGRGIGKRLLEKAEGRLSRPMELKVTIDNFKASQFYEKHGWQKISTHEDVPVPYLLFRKY